MDIFFKSLKFALNIYVLSTFIVLVVLGIVNLMNKCLQKKNGLE